VVSRLGTWEPTDAAEQLDQLRSLAEIKMLPARYGLAVDSRDLDALVALFVPDVQVGRDARGREALRAWFATSLSQMRTTVHFIGNHVVDFDDADHAHGVVYCRDELEFPELGEWRVGVLQYWDSYERVDGEWCFERRKFHRWYMVDALSRPGHGVDVRRDEVMLTTHQLPEAFDSWARFWAEVDA